MHSSGYCSIGGTCSSKAISATRVASQQLGSVSPCMCAENLRLCSRPSWVFIQTWDTMVVAIKQIPSHFNVIEFYHLDLDVTAPFMCFAFCRKHVS